MPFDSMPIADTRNRLLALDETLLNFGASPQAADNFRQRPIPAWHSSRHSERVAGAVNVLVRARALIADEKHWCRKTYSRGWRGLPVPVQSAAAHRFCALGAIMRAGRELEMPFDAARNALEWQTVRPIQDWNDDPGRTHDDVLAAFDAAIDGLSSRAG